MAIPPLFLYIFFSVFLLKRRARLTYIVQGSSIKTFLLQTDTLNMKGGILKKNNSKKNSQIRYNEQGFTLIELMVVIVILGILAGMIVPQIMDRPDDARLTMAKVDIGAISQALKLYKLDNGKYPTTDQGLQALIEPPSTGQLAKKWRNGGYLDKNAVPQDPWKNDYIYISPGLHGDFDLMSYGQDNEPGGEDMDADINSWEL
jgi:general secretion pathway protein G